jgi:hypothetical protein
MAKFSFLHQDRDAFRSYYRANETGALWCLQDDSTPRRREVNFYVCTRQGEPIFSVDLPATEEFDRFVDPSVREAADA